MDGTDLAAIKLLDQIGTTVDRLHAQGYALYLELKARTWNNTRRVVVSGTPFKIHYPDRTETFNRCLVAVFTLYPAHNDAISIEVSIELMWTSARWRLAAGIGRYGPGADDYALLWSEQSDHHSIATLTDAMPALADTLIGETNQPWFQDLFAAQGTG